MKHLYTLLGLLALCICHPAVSQTPRILWTFDTRDMSAGQSAMDDIDNDGKYEIVFGCYRNDSMIYAINAENGSLLWKYKAAGSGDGCNDVAPLIYDIDGDGFKEVIVPSSCYPRTYCFDGATGLVKWTTITRGSDSPPVIADLEKNGNLEILHGEFGGWVRSINAFTGQTKWDLLVDSDSWVQTAPTIVDLNNDGQLDFVVATWGFSSNSRFYAYDGGTRALMWSVPLDGYAYHGTGIADLNGDGYPDLVIGDYSGKLHVLNGLTGGYLWSYQGPGYIGSPPVIADITGNGHCDIVITSGTRVIALNNTGGLLWQFTMSGGGTSFRGAVLADIDNDSLPDVMFGSTNGSVYALKGTNGATLWTMDLQAHYGSTLRINHAPVVGDFDGNDTLDLFVVGGYSEYPNFSVNYGRGYAIQAGKGTGPEWKMFQRDHYRSCSHCYQAPGIGIPETISPQPKFFFRAHPVPVRQSGILHFTTDPGLPFVIDIMDLTGRKVVSALTSDQLIPASVGLSPGIYWVKCATREGYVQQQKIIVTGR